MIYVFRHGQMDPSPLVAFAQSFKTTYHRPAKIEDALDGADCLTAIYYLVKKVLKIDLPLTFIGDMPRELLTYGEWRPLLIKIADAKCGDLIFVRSVSSTRPVSHMGIFLDHHSVFHCSAETGGTIIEDYALFSTKYVQSLNFAESANNLDYRNPLYKGKLTTSSPA